MCLKKSGQWSSYVYCVIKYTNTNIFCIFLKKTKLNYKHSITVANIIAHILHIQCVQLHI